MKLDVFLNGGQVIHSGVVIIEGNDVLKFKFPDNGVEYHIVFSNDETSEMMDLKAELSENKDYLTINIINSHLSNYVGNNELFEVATINNTVKLYIKFRVSNLTDVDERIFYYKWILK